MGVRGVLGEGGGDGLLGGYFSEQGSEGESGGLGDDSIPKQSEFIRSIVAGDTQLGIVHPTGSPISVSTQRGLSFANSWRFPAMLSFARI